MMVEEIISHKINIVDHIAMGDWLNFQVKGNSKYMASLFAATIWFIWNDSCDCIFRLKNPNVLQITGNAVQHIREFSTCSDNYKMMTYFMQNRPKPGFMGTFTATAWNVATGKGGVGFIIIDFNANVFLCRFLSHHYTIMEGKMEMELWALIHGYADNQIVSSSYTECMWW